MAWRGRSEMPAPLALPIQVSKQYILGVPTAPTPDLSWQVWVSLFPKEAGSFQGPAWEGQVSSPVPS